MFDNLVLSLFTTLICSILIMPLLHLGRKKLFFYKYFGVASITFLYLVSAD